MTSMRKRGISVGLRPSSYKEALPLLIDYRDELIAWAGRLLDRVHATCVLASGYQG